MFPSLTLSTSSTYPASLTVESWATPHLGPRLGPNAKLYCSQETDPDNFERWEALIKACESLEGGLNRNSSPQALMTFRDAFDRFLYNFPLLFGYWKKYADMEFNIAGPESAEMVCEWDSRLDLSWLNSN